MRRSFWFSFLAFLVAFVTFSCLFGSKRSEAGGWGRRRVVAPSTRVITPTSAVGNEPTPMLGSFYATPYMTVRGNSPTGGGYSPHGQYGTAALDMYGPLSAYRATSAPVTLYTRGYDGSVIPATGTGFSTPNLPRASSVIYPTPATHADRPRPARLPASWPSSINWIDQN